MVKVKYDKILDEEREEDIDVDSVDYLQFNTSYTTTPAEGKLYWNASDNTLNVGMKGSDVNLQVGQEMLLYAKNAEGVQINNGQAVRVLDASGSKPRVVLVNNLEEVSYDTIAVATENVAFPQYGYFTTYGYVRDFNTSNLTEGAAVYLDTTDGTFTSTMPTNPSTCIQIGICLYKHSNQGILFVDIHSHEIHRDRTITKEPTGFVSPENVIINYDPTTQKVTLTGTVEAYWQGTRVTILTSGWVSSAHTNTTGHNYFLYYDGTNFVWADNSFPGFDKLLICVVNYGASDKFAIRECHGLMQWQTHQSEHYTAGTYKTSGGTIPSSSYVLNSTTATNRRPDIDSTTLWDEDLQTVNLALTSKLYTKYNLTSTGIGTYTVETAEIISLSVNNPYYNSFSTPNWGQTLMPANSVATVWVMAIPVTASSTSQKYRYLFIQPQWVTLSTGAGAPQIAVAVAEELKRLPSELNLGTLTLESPELLFIGRIIIDFTTNWRIQNVSLITGNRYSQVGSPSGNFLSTVSTDATLTGNGTVSSPLTTNGLTATKTFYAASSSGGAVNVLNTVTIDKGIITAWTQV